MVQVFVLEMAIHMVYGANDADNADGADDNDLVCLFGAICSYTKLLGHGTVRAV